MTARSSSCSPGGDPAGVRHRRGGGGPGFVPQAAAGFLALPLGILSDMQRLLEVLEVPDAARPAAPAAARARRRRAGPAPGACRSPGRGGPAGHRIRRRRRRGPYRPPRGRSARSAVRRSAPAGVGAHRVGRRHPVRIDLHRWTAPASDERSGSRRCDRRRRRAPHRTGRCCCARWRGYRTVDHGHGAGVHRNCLHRRCCPHGSGCRFVPPVPTPTPSTGSWRRPCDHRADHLCGGAVGGASTPASRRRPAPPRRCPGRWSRRDRPGSGAVGWAPARRTVGRTASGRPCSRRRRR